MNKQHAKKKSTGFRLLLTMLYLASITIFLYYFIDGISYYKIPIPERPHHADYRNLRPAGNRGHGFGIIGSGMMLLLFLYSIRKRTRIFNRLGNIDKWMNIHIFLGIIGPLFIILHTTFKVKGLIAVSFWSMIAVALSGVLGRYLYNHIPHGILGDELSLTDLQQASLKLTRRLKETFKLNDVAINKLEQLSIGRLEKEKGAISALISMIKDDFTGNRKTKKIASQFVLRLGLPKKYLYEAHRIVYTKIVLMKRMLLLNKIQALFHFWHVIHKPFAIIMIVIMFIHIAITVLMGYTWLF
jgi:hypothetical protein